MAYSLEEAAKKRDYYLRNRASIREKAAVRYSTPEGHAKARAAVQALKAKDVEAFTAAGRASYQRRRESIIAKTVARQKAKPEIYKAWRAANPGRMAAIDVRQRAARKQAVPAWLSALHLAEIRAMYAEAAARNLEVDHIVPLRGKTVCGLHVPWNLQLLTKTDNRAKGNRLLEAA